MASAAPRCCILIMVVNRSGGLIYSKVFGTRTRIDLNDMLRLASIWHSMHAIASQLSPAPHCGGIAVVESDAWRLQCYQAATGIKFLMLMDQPTAQAPDLLTRIHEAYVDCVLKNPFFELDQVIKCQLFDDAVEALAAGTG